MNYKSYLLCCSKLGYIYCFYIYEGAKKDAAIGSLGASEQPVINLTLGPLFHVEKGSLVCFERWFNSISLLSDLRSHDINAVGTIMTNRKGMPLAEQWTLDKQMSRGQMDQFFEKSKGVFVSKWKDSKIVYFASNFYPS